MATSRRGVLAASVAAFGMAAALPRTARALAGDLADAPFIDSFGVVGTADDTATFAAALGSGAPVRLRAITYRVRGPVHVRSPVVMLHGTPGLSRIQAVGLDTGPWFRVESNGLVDFEGIVWDGGGAATGDGVGAVAVLGTPQTCSFRRCAIRRATNPAGLLLSLNPDAFDEPMLVLDEVQAGGNRGQGIWMEHASNAVLARLRLHDNGQRGLYVARFGNRAGAPIQRLVVRDSFAWKNGNAGFGIGTYNDAPGGQPAVLGPDLPDAVDVELSALFAWGNGGYGIAVQSQRVRIAGCRTRGNGPEGGMVGNARLCDIQDCLVEGERGFGIDVGGAHAATVARCRIRNIDGVGLNAGGSIRITGSENIIESCTREAVSIWNTERGGREHSWLKYQTNHIRLRDTTVGMDRQAAGQFAITVRDGARNVYFDGLDLMSADSETAPDAIAQRALMAVSDGVRLNRIRFDGQEMVAIAPQGRRLVVPDIAVAVRLPNQPVELDDVVTATMARVGDGIGWITVTAPGTSYDAVATTARLEGDGDVAAVGKLVPNVWSGGGGQLIGFRLPAPGRGFTHAKVVLGGAGSGATCVVQIGVPLPRERRLRLMFPGGGRLGGRLPALTLASGSLVELMVSAGRWIVANRT